MPRVPVDLTAVAMLLASVFGPIAVAAPDTDAARGAPFTAAPEADAGALVLAVDGPAWDVLATRGGRARGCRRIVIMAS